MNVFVYEVIKTEDAAGWRLGNSIELSQEEAIAKIKSGEAKLADYPKGKYPIEWEAVESKRLLPKNIKTELKTEE